VKREREREESGLRRAGGAGGTVTAVVAAEGATGREEEARVGGRES
jgi:hypothetical protein